jgi:hypothetical protein
MTTGTGSATHAGGGDELYCLLVPLADERLILPRSCVT